MAPDGQNFRAVNAIKLLSNAKNITLDQLITKGYGLTTLLHLMYCCHPV